MHARVLTRVPARAAPVPPRALYPVSTRAQFDDASTYAAAAAARVPARVAPLYPAYAAAAARVPARAAPLSPAPHASYHAPVATGTRYAPQGSYTGGSTMCTSAAVFWAVACAARLARPQCPEAVMRALMQRAAATHVAVTTTLRQPSTYMLQQNEARACRCHEHSESALCLPRVSLL